MPPTSSPTTDHEAAWDVLYELTRTMTAALEKWHEAHAETADAWKALRDAFTAIRMTAEIGEEVCDDAVTPERHLTVAPDES